MISLGIILIFAIRVGLVLLFLPFSALDKLLNFKGAVAQAREVAQAG
jgi:putative oxidoreductase